MKNGAMPSVTPSLLSKVKRRSPFRIGLRRLKRATPQTVYRFRRRVKRLRVYLALYALPSEAPSSPALDKLFRRAGKLRQAYLYLDWVKANAPDWKAAAKAEVRYRKRRLLKAYKALRQPVREALSAWKKRFPPPWKGHAGLEVWQQQGRRWIEAHKAALRAFPEPPYSQSQIHELRTLCRRWELAQVWVELDELPPQGLTALLGDARDLYLLWRWLQEMGAPEALLHRIQRQETEKESEALHLWQSWRSSLG